MSQVQQQQYQSPTKVTGSCFRCNKPGHWARFCPESPHTGSPISPLPAISTLSDEFPATHCQCGAGICEIRISKSERNPNRKYYRCPGKRERYCGYFKWCDQLKREEMRTVQLESFPICGCGAGVCSVKVEENGVNAGRSYFICPIKKGEGACNFRQWLDNSPESTTSTILEGPIPDQTTVSLLDEFDLSPEAEMQIDALQMVAHENSVQEIQVHMPDNDGNMVGGVYERPGESTEDHLRGVTMETRMCHFHVNNVQASAVHKKDDEDEMVGEVCERPEETPEAYPCVVNGTVSETLYRKRVIQSSDTMENRVGDPKTYNLLAAIVATIDNTVSEDNLNRRLETQPRTERLSNPSNILEGEDEGGIMTGIIIRRFDKLALLLKNDLINLLESMCPMCPRIPERMKEEADCTFAALDRLQADYGLFQARVSEYIKQAASLYQIVQIINNDDASAQEQHNNEQHRFDEIFKAHCDAKDAFMESNRQLSLLRERASCPKDSLVELDKELSSCEAENHNCQHKLLQITKTMAECMESLQAAYVKATAAQKNSEKWKIERSAAEAKFQEARVQLRYLISFSD